MKNNFEKLKDRLVKIADIQYSAAVLAWDQETYMPAKGAEFRAGQLSTLAGIQHEFSISKEFEVTLSEARETDERYLSDWQKKSIEIVTDDFVKRKKYSTQFVEELSRSISSTFQSWQEAKRNNNFQIFAHQLEKLVELKKKECEILGYEGHPYNAMLNEYEKGLTVDKLDKLFGNLKQELSSILNKIKSNIDDHFFRLHYCKQKQWDFSIEILKKMGYNFEGGRQDLSTHPFTIQFNPNDVRVTTRVNENDLAEIIWSSIHEGGHALYEQGLPAEGYGTPLAEACSLGIHESQSRVWENNVGRSRQFWDYFFPRLKELFPDNLKNISTDDFYKGMNKVQPTLIRTNADELTYHFHVIIRYEIEKDLFEGKIKVSELPKIWNEKYKSYLGLDVPCDAEGVLQDVHWSHGSFGYFPTYSLGSLYAAQFFHQAGVDIPDLYSQIKKGDFSEFLKWLREKIHRKGRLYTSDELCIQITGESLNSAFFLNYAVKKYGVIYGFK